jgi:phosphopantothenoylcysteine decarboxylase / phosphopantothenate---cysteine ligase
MEQFEHQLILGIGGGIAAYKSCDLLRRLLDKGYEVTVVPTPSSLNFVGAATWEALSGRKVTTEVFESVSEVRHISLAKLAQSLVIAPATADLIARIAQGRADDLLTNVVLAADCPVLVVPAMHPNMWSNAATQANVATLRKRGFRVLEPAVGALTSGDSGKGRFPTTETIIGEFEEFLGKNFDLKGRKVLVTAGGTREAIDPVRFIGNLSSGKQGYAIARAAMERGAEVTLIAANSTLADIPGLRTVAVESAAQMKSELDRYFDTTDILFMAAAVADARPATKSDEKIKKSALKSIDLLPNEDLLSQLGARKKGQIIVAFAAESSLDTASALAKMASKAADFIYLNDVSGGKIFNSEMTQGILLTIDGSREDLSQRSKDTLAHLLLDRAKNRLG